jgi:hypothetical protein
VTSTGAAGRPAQIAGLVFVAQGSGYFPHPAESFMINQTRWVYYGAAIALAEMTGSRRQLHCWVRSSSKFSVYFAHRQLGDRRIAGG